uniref:Uncharacterized protein n=1 Tax=Eptatretus burgeri TaxID=7764 RepID=A0A8C4QZZ8_EPTBU
MDDQSDDKEWTVDILLSTTSTTLVILTFASKPLLWWCDFPLPPPCTPHPIGKIMLDLSVLMEEEYMGYCCNYDAAQAALEKYNEDPQMAKIIIQQESQLKHRCTSLSILIQPVQRIMRYPLLLDNLIAKMPPELLGYAELQAATSRFKDINVSINDTKRQQDLRRWWVGRARYTSKHRESVSERLSHLNINTVRKMSSRFGVQFRQAAGFLTLVSLTRVWNLHNNPHRLKCSPLPVTCQRNRLEELVQMPATDLLRAFKIPMFLIQKRNDKLLDVSGSDDGDEDIQHHRSYLEYQTLHSQLLDGLPKFCVLSASLECLIVDLICFTIIVILFLRTPLILKLLRKMFNIAFASSRAESTDICIPAHVTAAYLPLSLFFFGQRRAERRELVFQAHEPSRLYVLRANTWVGNGVDLQLLCGDIVGFLKAHDGSGCSARWLVDCGGIDHKRYIIPKGRGSSGLHHPKSAPSPFSPLNLHPGWIRPSHFRLATYPFQADGPRQMDLIAGQHVHLKRSHDVSGNPEWWLVESNGSDGFVPRAYLVAANSPRHQQSPYPHQKQ